VDDRSEFRTKNTTLTLGADKRLSDTVVVGAALGWINGRTRFTSNLSRQKMEGSSLAGYASWNVTPTTYVALTMNHDWSKFALERDGGVGSLAKANTRSTSTGIGLSGGYDHVHGAWTFSPYARWDTLQSRIRGFDEYGSSDAVSVGAQRMRSQSINVGLNTQYNMPQSWGVLLPFARVEFTNQRDQAPSAPSARLLSDNSPLLIPTASKDNRDFGTFAMGLNAITPHGYSFFLDYQRAFGIKGYRLEHLTLGVRFELR
jgi:outer membrane autotransporter protein